MVADLVGCCGG